MLLATAADCLQLVLVVPVLFLCCRSKEVTMLMSASDSVFVAVPVIVIVLVPVAELVSLSVE